MKTAKKIFVCLLAVVVSLSAFALCASADDAVVTYTHENLADVLEYYTESEMLRQNFEDVAEGAYTDGIYNGKSTQTAEVVADENGKHLVLTGGRNAINSGSMFVTWNGEEGNDDFVYRVTLMTTDDDTTANKSNRLVLAVNDATVSDAEQSSAQSNGVVVGTELICFDFVAGTVIYYDPASITKTSVLKKANGSDYAIAEGTYYTLYVEYSADGTYSLTVTSLADGSSATAKGITSPYATVKHVAVGEIKNSMAKTTVHLDDIWACGGTYIKDFADKTVSSEAAIATVAELCESENDLTPEEKIAAVEVGKQLVELGYVTDNADLQAVIDKLPVYEIIIYYNLVVECIANVESLPLYVDRVANVESYKKYYDAVPEDLSVADEELRQNVLDAMAAYDAEVLALENFKRDSDEYIAIVAEIDLAAGDNIVNYEYLKSYYDRLSPLNPYDGYEGVTDAKTVGESVINLYTDMYESATAFLASVATATDLENGFRTRYDAYFDAKNSYYDNETYPGITDALYLYAELDAQMVAAIALCDGFVQDVISADYSQYIIAKEQSIASAGAVLDEIKEKYLEYPDMTDYVALYEDLLVQISASRAAADSYIACIDKLREDIEAGSLSGDALWARISEAVELQKTGNVSGISGIAQANIYLNNVKSEYELSEGYSTQFDVLVGKLDTETNGENRFAIILSAMEAEKNAENYDGVSAETAQKLDAAVADYNETVRAINAAFTAVNETACNVASATSGAADSSMGRVIALIKKFYE